MQLIPEDVESAFVDTVREQVNGEAFDWARVAYHLNERLADKAHRQRAAFILGDPRPATRELP